MKPAVDRAAMLRRYAEQILKYADYFERRHASYMQAFAAGKAPGASEAELASEHAKFHADSGSHAIFQRIEFEAALFDAWYQFSEAVRDAERDRSSQVIETVGDDVHSLLQQVARAIGGAPRVVETIDGRGRVVAQRRKPTPSKKGGRA